MQEAAAAFRRHSRGLRNDAAGLSFKDVLVAQLCPILCRPMDCTLLGSSVCGILQARILELVALLFSRQKSNSRPLNQTWSSSKCRVLYNSTDRSQSWAKHLSGCTLSAPLTGAGAQLWTA